MKVIVTYASAGAGHFKAAEAIYNCFKTSYKDVDVVMADALRWSLRFFKISYLYGYSFLVRHLRCLWRLGFWLTSFSAFCAVSRLIAKILNRIQTRGFAKFLEEENADFIISTHFLCSEIAGHLKIRQKIKSKVISVITDFGVHPFWLSEGIDYYIVGSDITMNRLKSEGVNQDNIKVLGIPVGAEFLAEYSKIDLCHKFNLNNNEFTCLIFTGSFGIGQIEEIVEALHTDVQIIVVTARNQRLYKKLKNKNYPSVRVFGFIDNIHELMAVSDIIITKPGGLSIAESLVMKLFPIFISPIPGQEEENIRVMAEYGVGIEAKDAKCIKNIILDFKNNPDKLKEAKNRIEKIRKPFATKAICDVVR